MLPERVHLALLAHLDAVPAGLEQKGEARAGEEVDAARGVVRVRLVAVQVVQLRDALVETAADAAEGDNVDARRRAVRGGVADVVDGFAKVGGFLVGDVDDFGGGRLRGVEVADNGVEGVEVADDDLEVGLHYFSLVHVYLNGRWRRKTYEFTVEGGEFVKAIRAPVGGYSHGGFTRVMLAKILRPLNNTRCQLIALERTILP